MKACRESRRGGQEARAASAWRHEQGQTDSGRGVVEPDRADAPAPEAAAVPGTQAQHQPPSPHGHPVSTAAPKDGMRQRRDMLAEAAHLAGCRCLAGHPYPSAGRTAPRQRTRPVVCRGRLRERAGRGRGGETGANPTDRSQPGSKHHLATNANRAPVPHAATRRIGRAATSVPRAVPIAPSDRGEPQARNARPAGLGPRSGPSAWPAGAPRCLWRGRGDRSGAISRGASASSESGCGVPARLRPKAAALCQHAATPAAAPAYPTLNTAMSGTLR